MKTLKLTNKIFLSTGLICCSSLSFAFTVTYVNKCNYPIWLKDQVSGAKSVNNIEVNTNATITKDYGASFSGYAMWAAGGCNADGSGCTVGALRKNETLFEITVPDNPAVPVSSYDISLVDGYTFPMSITVDPASLSSSTRPSQCQDVDASRLDLGHCPQRRFS
jgi:hypothetical protein